MWGATCSRSARIDLTRNFNPRTPCGVRLSLPSYLSQILRISIHAPRVGCDIQDCLHHFGVEQFQSTHPAWGATVSMMQAWSDCMISIHAPRVGCDRCRDPPVWRTPCGVRPQLASGVLCRTLISIHAPRVGCDRRPSASPPACSISIHAPRVGCDRLLSSFPYRSLLFQSTHPVWGATYHPPGPGAATRNFNPRTPCGVRLRTMAA